MCRRRRGRSGRAPFRGFVQGLHDLVDGIRSSGNECRCAHRARPDGPDERLHRRRDDRHDAHQRSEPRLVPGVLVDAPRSVRNQARAAGRVRALHPTREGLGRSSRRGTHHSVGVAGEEPAALGFLLDPDGRSGLRHPSGAADGYGHHGGPNSPSDEEHAGAISDPR